VIRVNYYLDTSACGALEGNMLARLYEEFTKLNILFSGNDLCPGNDCHNLMYETDCSVTGKRRKRQTSSATVAVITIPSTSVT